MHTHKQWTCLIHSYTHKCMHTHTHTHTCARIHTHREKDGGEREREGMHRYKQWNTQKFLLTRHHQRLSCLQPGKVSWRGVPRQEHWLAFPAGSALPPELHHTLQLTVTQVRILHLQFTLSVRSAFPSGSALTPELHHTLQLTVTQVWILHLQFTLSVRSAFPSGSALTPELHHTLQLTVTQVWILHLQFTLSVRSASLVISWQSQYTATCCNTARNFPVHTHRVWSASLDGLKLHPRTHYKTLQYQYKHYSSHYWIFGFSGWLEISSRATLQNIIPVQTLQFTSFDHQLLWLAWNFLPGHVTKHNNTSTNITVHIIWSSASPAGFKLPPALDYSTRHYKRYNTPYKYYTYTSNSLLNSSTASLKLSPGLHYNILHTLNAYKQYSSLFDDQLFKISS